MTTKTSPAEEVGVGSLDGEIRHCGQPMTKKSTNYSWTGKPGEGAAHTTVRLKCEACGAKATLSLVEEC